MKLTNIIITAILIALTVITCIGGLKTDSPLLGAIFGVLAMLSFCSIWLLLEDLEQYAKRRKRRAMAVKMHGYSELRSGAWLKEPAKEAVRFPHPENTGDLMDDWEDWYNIANNKF